MDQVAATQWCEVENFQQDSSVVIDIHGVSWTVEKIRQAVKTLVPDQKVLLIDIKPNQENSHTYALIEWSKGIPTFFKWSK